MPDIDHIGYVVRNFDEKKDFIENLLGLKLLERKVWERGGARTGSISTRAGLG